MQSTKIRDGIVSVIAPYVKCLKVETRSVSFHPEINYV